MTDIDSYLHTTILLATQEARQDRSTTIEAHHLLLAIAADTEPTTTELLGSVGLDRDAIRAALDREFTHALGAAGVTLAPFGLAPESTVDRRQPRLGASAKLAMERGFASAPRKRDCRPIHLLLGILLAHNGTVPRALALAGVDRAALVAEAQQ
jgi:ATP-dependent Clp protease ATP-binding subunit ClpA